MNKKLNCWEYNNCGREKNGIMVPIHGECPVSTTMKYDGLNGGVGAGRVCWLASKSKCHLKSSTVQKNCRNCSFYKRVMFEQEDSIKAAFTV